MMFSLNIVTFFDLTLVGLGLELGRGIWTQRIRPFNNLLCDTIGEPRMDHYQEL